MTDIKFEKLFTLAEVAKRLPRRGRNVSVSTLYRWLSPRAHRDVPYLRPKKGRGVRKGPPA